ncbi:MAG: hypothetical protein AAF748_00365 [Pseudomonadota bacterium]
MAQNGFLSLAASLVFSIAGLSMVASNFDVVRDGLRLLNSDETALVEVVDKNVERPTRRAGARVESISVNGTKARSIRTYFNSYFATVSPSGQSGGDTWRANVGYHAWHNLQAGNTLEVTVASNVTEYADPSKGATLQYGLKQMGIGFAIILLGIGVMFLPSEREEKDSRSYS